MWVSTMMIGSRSRSLEYVLDPVRRRSGSARCRTACILTKPLFGKPALRGNAQAKIILSFSAVTLIGGSNWIVIRDQLGTVSPSWSVTYRFVIASAAMLVLAWVMRIPLRLKPRDHIFAFIVGATQFCLNFNFIYQAEQVVTSGLVALVFAMLVGPNALLAWLFLRQGVSMRFTFGTGVALVGLTLFLAPEVATSSAGREGTIVGLIFIVAGVFSASIANEMQATSRARSLPMISFLAWAMLWGALADAVWATIIAGPPTFDFRPSYVAGLLYLGVIASAVAFTLYFNIIRTIGPGRAAFSCVLVPIIAMALSTIFEDYRWSWTTACGAALTLLGLVISLNAHRLA